MSNLEHRELDGDNSQTPHVSPESIVEEALWKLGSERPECRDVVFEIVTMLRKKVKGATISARIRSEEQKEINMESDDPLRDSILACQRDGMTIAQIALNAGVSTKTITEAKLGRIRQEVAAFKEKPAADNRTLRGIVKKTTRLAMYFGFDPALLISHYGLPKSEALLTVINQACR